MAIGVGGLKSLSVCVVSGLVLASCASTPEIDAPVGVLAVPDDMTSVAVGELRVAPLDVLDISVFNVPELGGSYQVDPQGNIRLPLVGIVNARGYSTFELSQLLEQRLGESYLRDPQVTVRISSDTRQQFTIEGGVENPGLYPISGPMTLLQTVALSGGPTDDAVVENVLIYRTIEGERRAARFDLNDIRTGESEDPAIFGSDIIVVFTSETRRNYQDVIRAIPLLGLFLAV